MSLHPHLDGGPGDGLTAIIFDLHRQVSLAVLINPVIGGCTPEGSCLSPLIVCPTGEGVDRSIIEQGDATDLDHLRIVAEPKLHRSTARRVAPAHPERNLKFPPVRVCAEAGGS